MNQRCTTTNGGAALSRPSPSRFALGDAQISQVR